MKHLFDNDPVFRGIQRDSLGRFATREKAAYDKTKRENKYLRLQVEKYRRLSESADETIFALQRIIHQQNLTIQDLRNEKKRRHTAR